MNELLRDLRSELATDRVLIVVGSGVSIGATGRAQAATWSGLVQLGIDRCLALHCIDAPRARELSTRLTGSPPTDDLISVAQSVSQCLQEAGRGEYARWLKETVGALTATDSKVLRELSRLKVDMATTNYDNLLEDHVKDSRSVTWQDTAGILGVLRRQSRAIIHLHGHWNIPDSVILGFKSYENILRSESAQAILMTLPMLRTLVFVGCGEGLRDPNFKNLLFWYGKVLDSAEHRHYRLVTHHEVNEGRIGGRIFDIEYGTTHDDLPDFIGSLSAPKPIIIGADSKTHITINLDQWINILSSDSRLTNTISDGDFDAVRANAPFATLCSLIDQHTRGLFVEAISVRDGSTARLDSLQSFLLDAVTLMVLRDENLGHLKGVLKKAISTMGKDGSPKNFSSAVFESITARSLPVGSPHHDARVAAKLVRTAIDVHGSKDADGLFRLVTHLLGQNPKLGVDCLRQMNAELVLHDAATSVNPQTPRNYMKAVKYLVELTRIEERAQIGLNSAEIPKVMQVPVSGLTPYRFQILQTPITNLQWYEITGRHIDQSRTRPTHPFVFEIFSSSGHELYESLAAEIISFISAINRLEEHVRFEWDIATGNEWLSAAGCEKVPYPWGNEVPTSDHANLRFGKDSASVLQPVGLYPNGRSPHGLEDCCGNVHEIVRVAAGDEFPGAFRLAGGCFQNRPHSCQYLREFRRRPVDTRRNVGVRLVRYLREDVERRRDAIAVFKPIGWVRGG